MSASAHEERRPAQSAVRTSSQNPKHSLTACGHPSLARLAVALASVRNYAVLVSAERADGIVASQLYTNLAAAERKVKRTRDRGLSASLTLVQIVAATAPIPAEYRLETEAGEAR